MVIEISTAMLDNLKLTPDEYYIITLVRHKEFDILSEFLKTNYIDEDIDKLYRHLLSLGYLTSTSYLMNHYDWEKCKLSNKIYALIRTEDLFEEFLAEYPKSVIRSDGVVDYLRTDQRNCRQLYGMITKGQRAMHDHIIKCLRFEVDKRTRDGSMKFMVRMSKWLTSEAWTAYEDEITNPKKVKIYGTEIE